MPIIQQTLQNKAVLITEPIATSQTVAIGFWFSAGSRFETTGKHGISHFVEHMLFKGTENRSCCDIAYEFDRMGGFINAFTEREQLCVYCVVPKKYCESSLKILEDMIYHSVFDGGDVEREREVIKSEIISSLDDPEDAAIDTVLCSIWEGNSISLSIAGSVQDVEGLTREDLFDWYETCIKNGPLVISISGNFDTGKVASIVNGFDSRERLTVLPSTSVPEWKNRVEFFPADFQQEQLIFAFPINNGVSIEKNIAFSVLNAIIGDTMSSRLFQKLREQCGYCYNVYSFFNIFEKCGFWLFYATSNKSNCLNVAGDFIKTVSDFFTYEVSDDEIDFAKKHLAGEEIIASEDTEQRMKFLARSYFYGYDILSSEKYIKLIENIDRKYIVDVLSEYSAKDEFSFFVYGPKLAGNIKKKIRKEVGNEFKYKA